MILLKCLLKMLQSFLLDKETFKFVLDKIFESIQFLQKFYVIIFLNLPIGSENKFKKKEQKSNFFFLLFV